MQLSRQSPECDDAVTVTVEGDITAVKLSPFSEPLADLLGSTAYSQRVLLDLSSATAIDSSGIHWLLKLHQQCESSQGRLVLQGVSPYGDGHGNNSHIFSNRCWNKIPWSQQEN